MTDDTVTVSAQALYRFIVFADKARRARDDEYCAGREEHAAAYEDWLEVLKPIRAALPFSIPDDPSYSPLDYEEMRE